MLRILNLKHAFGGHEVLKDVSFEVGDREKVALVGPNGAGKSTVLKILAGQLTPDEGSIRQQGEASREVAYLPQDAGVRSGRTLWDEMLSTFPELQQAQAELTRLETAIGDAASAGDDDKLQELIDRQGELLERFEQLGGYAIEAEVAKVLDGLGFESQDRDKATAEFSGGWQMRIALARMLVRKPSVLLLDEPTNHLDLAACEWLEAYLVDYPSLILVVSHDRYFLDRVTTRTIELADGVADRLPRQLQLLPPGKRPSSRRAQGRLRPPAEVHRASGRLHQRHEGQRRSRGAGQEPRAGARQTATDPRADARAGSHCNQARDREARPGTRSCGRGHQQGIRRSAPCCAACR